MGGFEDYGRYAYDAYCRSSGGKSLISGDALPPWDALSTEIQRAWIAAAAAVLDVAKSTGER